MKLTRGFNGTLCLVEDNEIKTCFNDKDAIQVLKELKERKEQEIKQLVEWIRYFDGQR